MSRYSRSYGSANRRRRAVSGPAAPRRPAPRRQRVALRGRRREALSRQMHGIIRRGAMALGVFGIAAFFMLHSHSWIQRELERHTPSVMVEAPAGLGALPVDALLPAHRWLLWMPGAGFYSARRIKRHFPTVKAVRLEPDFAANRVILHLDARLPLALWNGSGVDADGVVFPLMMEAPATLPQLHPAHTPPARTLGPWLAALSRIPWLWSPLINLTEDEEGHWTLVSTHGPALVWGSSDEPVAPRAAALQKVLADAQAEHGGAVRADLRFFDEGRIIVGVRRSPH